jgi:hypothetical protein
MRWRAVASGGLALVVLQVLVTSKQTGRIGSLFALPATWAQHLIDPSIPAIPDRTLGAGSPGSPPAHSAVYTLPPSTTNAAPQPASKPTYSA